ncbi:MAG: SDR family oxidoreductase [Alphaproteobacteria bacterium]
MTLVTVFGASGRMGQAQVRQLLLAGYEVRAITRKKGVFKDKNVIEVSADYNDPESLDNAIKGSDAVFYNKPSFEQVTKMIDFCAAVGAAAARADIRLIYQTAAYAPDDEIGQYNYDRVLATERALKQGGARTTIFRPVLFMDNTLTKWARNDIIENDEFAYPHKEGLQANWICLDDVAKFMIAALERDDLIGKAMVIGGPEVLTPQRIADTLSGHLGRSIKPKTLTPKEFAIRMADIFEGVSDIGREDYIAAMQGFYEYNNENTDNLNPFKVDMEDVLEEIPIKLTTFSEWVKQQDWVPIDDDITTPSGG